MSFTHSRLWLYRDRSSEIEPGDEVEDDSEGGEEVGDTLAEYRDERSREGCVQRRQRAGLIFARNNKISGVCFT